MGRQVRTESAVLGTRSGPESVSVGEWIALRSDRSRRMKTLVVVLVTVMMLLLLLLLLLRIEGVERWIVIHCLVASGWRSRLISGPLVLFRSLAGWRLPIGVRCVTFPR